MPRLSGLDADWIDLFLGIDFAITELGERLDEVEGAPHLYETTDPSYEQRRAYALGVLSDLKARRTAAQAPVTEEGSNE